MSPYGFKSPKPGFTAGCVGHLARKSSIAGKVGVNDSYRDRTPRKLAGAIPTSTATKQALRRISKRAARREGKAACQAE